MSFSKEFLEAAHKHSFQNRAEIEASENCFCFYCRESFAGRDVTYWIPDDGGDTAVCPLCPVDSVIGSASGLPVDDAEFLAAMHSYWIKRTANA
jgi:hypothetical protein